MKLMEINKRTFYYSLYCNKSPRLDEWGNESGEYSLEYSPALKIKAHVSHASGEAVAAQFGRLEDYDKIILTDDMACPIDEYTVIFLDKKPEYDSDGVPLGDYIVRRVAKSFNSISYAVSKVVVS